MNNPIGAALFQSSRDGQWVEFTASDFKAYFETRPEIGKSYAAPHNSSTPAFGTPVFKVLSKIGSQYYGVWSIPQEWKRPNYTAFIPFDDGGAE